MRHRISGVTLMELMIVMVIVGILAAIAYPSYRSTILKSSRADAKIAISQAVQELEKCFTRNNTYLQSLPTQPCSTSAALLGAGSTSPGGKYLVTGAITALAYTISATPQLGQADDTQCGTFTLDEKSVRGKTGTLTAAECWK